MNLETMNLQLYMRLDYSAIQALQIFPKKMQRRVLTSNETLFDILNSKADINKRLEYIGYFLDNPDMRKFIQNEVLNKICDLDKLYFTFYKVHSGKPSKCEMSDLLKLYKLIRALNNFK
jgi:DNA mismatch repair ATPase MutS